MNTKTRKIFSRIGAGLMLGLSLFNLGAAWQKGGETELPKRARQIRKREAEQLQKETQTIAEIAEQEGKAVIAQQQTQEESQVEINQQLSPAQLALRFTALAAWGVTASVFFASMLFNYPFALGRGVLSLLPGEPHTSMLVLESDQQYFEEKEMVRLQMKLDSNGDPVQMIKASLEYDPQRLMLDHYEISPDTFDKVKKFPSREGEIILLLEESKQPESFNQETIATLYFMPVSDGLANVEINKEDSLVVKKEGGNQYNILGDTKSAHLRVVVPALEKIACQKIEDGLAEKEETWRGLVIGTLLPREGRNWVALDQQRALLCHYDSQNVYLLFNGIEQDKPIIQFTQSARKRVIDYRKSLATWSQDGRAYHVLPTEANSFPTAKFTIQLEGTEEFRWPMKGNAQIILE